VEIELDQSNGAFIEATTVTAGSSMASSSTAKAKGKAPKSTAKPIGGDDESDEEEDDEAPSHGPLAIRQRDLVAQAFAGDNVIEVSAFPPSLSLHLWVLDADSSRSYLAALRTLPPRSVGRRRLMLLANKTLPFLDGYVFSSAFLPMPISVPRELIAFSFSVHLDFLFSLRSRFSPPFPCFAALCPSSFSHLSPFLQQGAWGGKGVKKSKKNPPKKFTKKIAGIEVAKRHDFGKSNVIISERKDKKAQKYTTKDLPYPYTSVAQYEASLSQPMGTEWQTRGSFQKLTLPKVSKKVSQLSFLLSSALTYFVRILADLLIRSLLLDGSRHPPAREAVLDVSFLCFAGLLRLHPFIIASFPLCVPLRLPGSYLISFFFLVS
jgi:hypothetical protein